MQKSGNAMKDCHFPTTLQRLLVGESLNTTMNERKWSQILHSEKAVYCEQGQESYRLYRGQFNNLFFHTKILKLIPLHDFKQSTQINVEPTNKCSMKQMLHKQILHNQTDVNAKKASLSVSATTVSATSICLNLRTYTFSLQSPVMSTTSHAHTKLQKSKTCRSRLIVTLSMDMRGNQHQLQTMLNLNICNTKKVGKKRERKILNTSNHITKHKKELTTEQNAKKECKDSSIDSIINFQKELVIIPYLEKSGPIITPFFICAHTHTHTHTHRELYKHKKMAQKANQWNLSYWWWTQVKGIAHTIGYRMGNSVTFPMKQKRTQNNYRVLRQMQIFVHNVFVSKRKKCIPYMQPSKAVMCASLFFFFQCAQKSAFLF